MCNSLTIYLKNNYPIVIEFAVGSLGELKLALAQKNVFRLINTRCYLYKLSIIII